MAAPLGTVVNPFTCRTAWKTWYASSGVMRVGDTTVTLPCTRSSMTKFLPVISPMNFTRTAMSTSWKSMVM